MVPHVLLLGGEWNRDGAYIGMHALLPTHSLHITQSIVDDRLRAHYIHIARCIHILIALITFTDNTIYIHNHRLEFGPLHPRTLHIIHIAPWTHTYRSIARYGCTFTCALHAHVWTCPPDPLHFFKNLRSDSKLRHLSPEPVPCKLDTA